MMLGRRGRGIEQWTGNRSERDREADAADAARCATRDGHAGQGWLILGHASEGRDHLLFVVELSWKITRGILISEADRAAEED